MADESTKARHYDAFAFAPLSPLLHVTLELTSADSTMAHHCRGCVDDTMMTHTNVYSLPPLMSGTCAMLLRVFVDQLAMRKLPTGLCGQFPCVLPSLSP